MSRKRTLRRLANLKRDNQNTEIDRDALVMFAREQGLSPLASGWKTKTILRKLSEKGINYATR